MKQTSKMKQTPADLLKHLQEQYGFMCVSAQEYDKGSRSESKRLALVLRTLFHDTSASNSVLSQLGAKATLKMPGCTVPRDIRLLPSWSILTSFDTEHGLYVPNCYFSGTCPPRLVRTDQDFETWWQQRVVMLWEGVFYSRKDIISLLADKDGGAHVDSELPEQYYEISREGKGQFSIGPLAEEKPVTNLLEATCRQIAQEAIVGLAQAYKFDTLTVNAVVGISIGGLGLFSKEQT